MLSKKSRFVALIFSVLFLSILKYVINQSTEFLPQIPQLIAYASLLIAGGSITLSLFSLLGTFSDVKNSAISRILKGVSEDPTRNFFVGFFTTAYLSLVRPPLAANVPFLPYMEWLTVAIAVYVMYTMTRLSSKEFYDNFENLSWKKHIQEVRRETGRELTSVTSAIEKFVDHEVKEPLLVYLALHLQRLGETDEDILKTLSPLIYYKNNIRRHKLYFLAFPWAKRKFAMRSKKAREKQLNTLLETIEGVRSK